MRKIILTLVILTTLLLSITAEELKYDQVKLEVINQTYLWRNGESDNLELAQSSLRKGEILSFVGYTYTRYKEEYKFRFEVNTKYDGKGYINTEDVVVVGENIFLPDSIISKRWVLEHYEDILKAKNPNRETFYIYEPFWRDGFVSRNINEQFQKDNFKNWWYFFSEFNYGNITQVQFKDNLVKFSGMKDTGDSHYFLINHTEKIDNTYKINITRRYYLGDDVKFGFTKKIADKKEYTFVLKQDGDYLKIYLDEEKEENLLEEFIAVDDYFVQAVYDVALNKPIIKSNIHWPKRDSER